MSTLTDRWVTLYHLQQYLIQKPQEPYEHVFQRERLAKEAGATTIGVEIEVRFSSFFPTVYEDYRLQERSYESMSDREKSQFAITTAAHEANLLPYLNKVTELGVPKGKDRYWEFAHRPAYHPYTLAEEINILRRATLIPKNQRHSLHITLGGLPAHRSAGMLLMVLEMLGYTSKQRMLSGINSKKAVSWSRKGRGGMRERSEGLEYGETVAVEFRTLELPTGENQVKQMLYVTWFLAETLRREDMAMSWSLVLQEALALADRNKIDVTSNWGPGFENVDKWTELAEAMSSIDNTSLWDVVKKVINYQDKLSPDNVYLRDGIPW